MDPREIPACSSRLVVSLQAAGLRPGGNCSKTGLRMVSLLWRIGNMSNKIGSPPERDFRRFGITGIIITI
jgi:hypothetical protein